jgi:SAM-dependent methyltransferase
MAMLGWIGDMQLPQQAVDWSGQLAQFDKTHYQLWRDHSDWIYLMWLQAWWPAANPRRVLKTDLFDEAVNAGLMAWLAQHSQLAVGLDISAEIARCASKQSSAGAYLDADVRRLPFEDCSFDLIFSPSSLDHFCSENELDLALREFRRVLSPGGRLFLALDNYFNPIVWLRNHLPESMLIRLGVIPYPIGVTCSLPQLISKLEQMSFSVCRSTTLLHCPRVFAVNLLPRINPRHARRLLEFLRKLERLSKWPSHLLTGYFIAVEAIRKD